MNLENYFFKNMIGKNWLLVVLFFLSFSYFGIAQVKVGFTPRKAAATPTKSIYNVKGDFTLIGNTNLTLNNYSVDGLNSNNTMKYVDIDGDNSTFNSSSANLTFSTENGAIPECSKVIYAGLYWTGRSSDATESPDTFNVTKGSVTKTFNKRKVKIKGPTAGSYTEVTAGTNDIYYPNSSDGLMYSAYAEITDYVKLNGVGQYTVADVALVEGNGGATGFYGGWGIVVVYENSKMKWRDITVFDGHAYVVGGNASHEIPISGFNAVQTGAVNVKLGLMAGEGDRGISGDYINIRNAANNSWSALSHTGNTTGNFFNSSIQTGGNTRNPNLVNNTGLDISMFNIDNPNNSIIGNSQTSTKLKYGSTQDTYVIFMAAMAVDAYIPEIEGVMSVLSIDGVPANNTSTVLPGQVIEYSIKLLNEGTEPINNAIVKIDIPYMATYVNGSATKSINFTPSPTPNSLTFDPLLGAAGTLIWNIGKLPIPANPSTVLGELRYKIKVTEDCFLLKNEYCVPSTILQGYINGVGAITGIQIADQAFIQGYEASGVCVGDPITDPIKNNIDISNYVDQNCQDVNVELSFSYCGIATPIPFATIAANYPKGTRFYNSYPVTSSSVEYTSTSPFPNTALGSTTYFAVPPIPNGCYFTLIINIEEIPTFTTPSPASISGCGINGLTPLAYSTTPTPITLQDFIDAGGAVSNSSLGYTITYQDTATGDCPTIITRKFTITTSCVTVNITQTITVDDTIAPTFTTPAPADVTAECDVVPTAATLVATDNCSDATVTFNEVRTDGTCENAYTLTRTWTATDVCGNETSVTQIVTAQDTTAPEITTQASNIEVECDGNGNIEALNAWLASNGGATGTDICSAITWSNNFSTVSETCGATGTATVIFTVTDECGNASTSTAIFTIVDTTMPVFTSDLPGNISVSCDAIPVAETITATDNCDTNVTITVTDTLDYEGSNCAGSYIILRTWTATDTCNNRVDGSASN